MKVHATVLINPTSDTPGTTLVLHFDDRRYIFGHIAEGSQRAFSERHTRLGKVEDIFLTGKTEWATIGGLVGFVLTIGDQRKGEGQKAEGRPVTVHGGENLLHSTAATRNFVFRGQLKIKVNEILEEDPGYRDNNIAVRALHIHPDVRGVEGSKKRRVDQMANRKENLSVLQKIVDGMFVGSQRNVNKNHELDEVDTLEAAIEEDRRDGGEVRKRSRTVSEDNGDGGEMEGLPTVAEDQQHNKLQAMSRNLAMMKLPSAKPSPIALSYIVTLHDHRGKFFPNIAKELGVPPGKSFGVLTRGKSVTTLSGRVVHPHEVMEPDKLGTGIAICDLPSVEYIADFASHREWSDVSAVEKKLGCFFWILGPGVLEDQRLGDFFKRFSNSKHVVASPEICSDRINFKGSARFAAMLNHLDPVFFPPLYSSTPSASPPEDVIVADPGVRWQIEPEWKLQVAEPYDPEIAIPIKDFSRNFLAIAADAHSALSEWPIVSFPGSDVEIYTLGTGSALPSRYRNVSATLVTIPNNCSVLLDCGESTVGQMKRVFQPSSKFKERLLDIKVLYISHLHADHHLGSISLIKEQRRLLCAAGNGNRKTFVVAPNRFWIWLNEYSAIEDIGQKHLVFISNEQLRSTRLSRYSAITPPHHLSELLTSINAMEWETAPALHCQSSFTTAITFSSGFKLAYSGDTRPTESFVDIGKDATLLVHEATFDDELITEAIAKKHSTIGEAIAAGRKMSAWKTALVHFSQRYPKAPTFGSGSGSSDNNLNDVVYGFDYMRFKVGEIGRFRYLIKGLGEIYKEQDDTNIE
jgi:ribonuclease Z